MTEWISVEDKYPENQQKVKIKILYEPTQEIQEIEATFKDYDDYRSWTIKKPLNLYDYIAKPTHWMPLPEPPTDEK